MDLLFVLSDVGPVSHQVIHTVTNRHQPVFAFVKDFESIPSLMQQYSVVTWILLDVDKEDRSKLLDLFALLPDPNYVVNVSGVNFWRDVAQEVMSSRGHAYVERNRARFELTYEGIVKSEDGTNCAILIQVVEDEERSSLKKKSRGVTKAVGRFMKGASKTLTNLTENEDDDNETNGEENAPLLPKERVETPDPGILASILACCFPCFCASEPEYNFQNPDELKAFIRSLQISEIQRSFKDIHERANTSWAYNLAELRRKESQKLEELSAKVEDLREEEEQHLAGVADQQNRNTRENLSNTLTEEMIKRIEASRSRQNKGKIDFTTSRAYREGKDLIRKQVAIDRAQLVQTHYSELVVKQLEKLQEIEGKYKRKFEKLKERCFGRATL